MMKTLNENGNIVDIYTYDTNDYTLLKDGKIIGHAYDSFCVIVDYTGVIAYGFESTTDVGTKGIKINKRKIGKREHRLYLMPFYNPDSLGLMNKLYIGFDFEGEQYNIMMKEVTKHVIYQKTKNHFNEIVLDADNKATRLIGLAFDSADFYYINKSLHGKTTYHSCVGGFIPLKESISTDDYDRLESIFPLNNCKSQTTMTLEMMDDAIYLNWNFRKKTKLQSVSEWFDAKLLRLRRKIVSTLQD